MYSLSFTKEAWEEYLEWQTADRRVTARINALIKDIQRNGFMIGIGKPAVFANSKKESRRTRHESCVCG
jgi:toxin YoeB